LKQHLLLQTFLFQTIILFLMQVKDYIKVTKAGNAPIIMPRAINYGYYKNRSGFTVEDATEIEAATKDKAIAGAIALREIEAQMKAKVIVEHPATKAAIESMTPEIQERGRKKKKNAEVADDTATDATGDADAETADATGDEPKVKIV
jgi:hypothetical protein